MTPIEELKREFYDRFELLREKINTASHEAFVRDEALNKRISEIAEVVNISSQNIETLSRDIAELNRLQTATDRRWNQLIDQLTREHKN